MGEADGAIVPVKVIPRAPRNEIAGKRGEEVLVRLKAPPVDGKANEALVAFLAVVLACPRSRIEIIKGETGRHKLIKLPQEAKISLERILTALEGT